MEAAPTFALGFVVSFGKASQLLFSVAERVSKMLDLLPEFGLRPCRQGAVGLSQIALLLCQNQVTGHLQTWRNLPGCDGGFNRLGKQDACPTFEA